VEGAASNDRPYSDRAPRRQSLLRAFGATRSFPRRPPLDGPTRRRPAVRPLV